MGALGPGENQLLGFEGEVGFGRCALLDFDVLGGSAGFAVGGLDFVFAWRDVGDLEGAVFGRDGKVRVIENADPGEHPGVNVALELQEHFGFVEGEGELRAAL